MADENVEIVRRVLASFNSDAFDPDAFELFDPEVELSEWPEGPDPRTFRGRDGMMRAQESWSEVWEWQVIEPTRVVEVGDSVFVELHHRAMGKGSTVEVEIDSYNVFTLRAGLITRMEMFTDRDAALRAAGLSGEQSKAATRSEETK